MAQTINGHPQTQQAHLNSVLVIGVLVLSLSKHGKFVDEKVGVHGLEIGCDFEELVGLVSHLQDGRVAVLALVVGNLDVVGSELLEALYK